MRKKEVFCIVFCVLMIVFSLTPVSAIPRSQQSSPTPMRGTILYVGGSGPGNYTTIQDAINDAQNGWTVFVYAGTYSENLVVNNAITLQGEDKDLTIIDGQSHGNVIYISTFHVTVKGFTIRNAGWGHYAGVWLDHANFNLIEGNRILENHFWGICLNSSSFNSITGNTLSLNDLGVEAGGLYGPGHPSNGNFFTDNVFSSNEYQGMAFGWSKRNVIAHNVFANSSYGITFWNNVNMLIYKNVFLNNTYGIELCFSRQNLVLCNNFFDNQYNVYFYKRNLLQRNLFLRNYWNGSSQPVVIIPGGFLARNHSFANPLKWFQIDWAPAKTPNTIP
jgi:nitrous oxidase accessory protein